MQVNSAVKEGNQVKISVTVDRESFEAGIQKAYNKQKSRIQLPGFRKGKAPRKMIEAMYGKDVFYEDGLNEIFPEVYQKLVLDEGWKAVGQPSVTELNYNDDMTVDLTIESALYPEVKLNGYKGLEVEKDEVKVTDEEVERELDKKAEEVARITTVERAAQDGDTVVIDFEGFLDGKPFEGGKGEAYELRLGSHSFVPGFEEQLIGAAAGDEKDLDVTFPEDYHEELAGKAVVFKVKVHEVKETVVPAKDDDLAKDVSEFDTLAELRADLRAGLEKTRQESVDNAFENAAIEKALENTEMDVPACMIDEQVERELERFDYQLRAQGMSLQQYSQMLGGDLSSFKNSIRPSAERQLKIDVMLNAIVDEEKLEASDEEAEAEYQKLADQYQMDLERVKKMIALDDLKGDLAVQKARKLIAESAVAVAKKAEEKPAEEKPARAKKTRAKKTEEKPAEETKAEEKTEE